LTKLFREEELDVDDWNDLLSFALLATQWVVKNTEVKVTTVSDQIHLQPGKHVKKNKTSKR